MEAIILAGGLGTRLRSVVNDVPKPMALIAGRPFLCWLMERLAMQGYNHLVLATGYMHEKVEAFFHDSYRGIAIDYAQETTPLGTGGAIVNALQYCTDECVTILNGDTLFDIDHQRLCEVFESNGGRLTIATRYVSDAGRYGTVEIDDATHRIVAFHEKNAYSKRGIINGGIYRMHRSLLANYAPGVAFSFEKDILQQLREPFYCYLSDAYFVDIGVPDDYARAETELKAYMPI